jgi:hypothetical protein
LDRTKEEQVFANGIATLNLVPEPAAQDHLSFQRPLLACGVLASALYGAMIALVPLGWVGYRSADRVVSELSAIGAPTRDLWVPLGAVWAVLMTAFGWGVWLSAGENRRLRGVGLLLLAYGLFNIFPWPPMHQREVLAAGGGTLTDRLHIVWSCAALSFMLVAMGFGAVALGATFRLYTVATMVVLVAFGVLTGVDSPRLSGNLPTPLIGVWERISIGAFLLWIAVLAVAMWPRFNAPPRATTAREGSIQ